MSESNMEPFQLPELAGSTVATEVASLELLHNVLLDVRIDFGRAYLRRNAALGLEQGAIVPLDKAADEPVDVFVGDRLIARGQIVELDGNYGVCVTELVAGAASV